MAASVQFNESRRTLIAPCSSVALFWSIDSCLCAYSSPAPPDFSARTSPIACLSEGHTVLGVDNLSTGDCENLAHLANDPRFRFEERDICASFDPGPVDYVFNLASPASPPEYLRLGIETLRVGSVGVENTLADCRSDTTRATCTLPLRSATATRWSIRRRRATGAT